MASKFKRVLQENKEFLSNAPQVVQEQKKSNEKVKRFTMDLTLEEYNFLKQVKAEKGMTASGLFRTLLNDYKNTYK